jgi:hypothetical protein
MPKISTNVRTPTYRTHKATGQAVVTLNGKDIYLGRFGSPASKEKYDRVIADWLANGRTLPAANSFAIVEIIDQFWTWAGQHYRHPDGSATSEVSEFRYALRPLAYLHGMTPACDFGPLAFKAVRQLLVSGYDHPRYGHQAPPCRRVINNRMERIKRMFRWATENELVHPSIYHGLLVPRQAIILG